MVAISGVVELGVDVVVDVDAEFDVGVDDELDVGLGVGVMDGVNDGFGMDDEVGLVFDGGFSIFSKSFDIWE
jgi:hypothetical protein